MHAESFSTLTEAERVEELFGHGSPGAEIGRECSLNLNSISKYGTLEVRRFHGTLDSTLLVHWAHFCVAFVEAFSAASRPSAASPPAAASPSSTADDTTHPHDGGGGTGKSSHRLSEASILSLPSSDAALLALQTAQEMASPQELMGCMRGYVNPETASYFLRDASHMQA